MSGLYTQQSSSVFQFNRRLSFDPCLCDYVCLCVCVFVYVCFKRCCQPNGGSDCLARVYQWQIGFYSQFQSWCAIRAVCVCGWNTPAGFVCVCNEIILFCLFPMSNLEWNQQREALSWFPGECQRFVVIVTLVSPILRVLLSWAIVKNFHFFRFSLRVESGEERWAGYYILSKRNISLSSFFRVCLSQGICRVMREGLMACVLFLFSLSYSIVLPCFFSESRPQL
jgi:hypothetical protein